MANRAFDFRETCAICDAELAFGSYHCEQCVKEHRVCTMCDTSIAKKSKRAVYCCDSCKVTASEKRNETPRIDSKLTVNSGGVDAHVLAKEVAALVIDQLQEQRDPLIGTTNRTAELLEEIRDLLKNQPRAAAPNPTMQQAPARNVSDDDLMDMLEVKEAEYDPDNNSSYNFILSVAGVASGSEFNLPPEVYEYAVRTGRMKAAPNNGPRQMDVPAFDEPDEDSFNDLIDLL